METDIIDKNKIVARRWMSPAGELVVGSHCGRLCLCDWMVPEVRARNDRRVSRYLGCGFTSGSTPVIDKAIAELVEYFDGRRRVFDVPVVFTGTAFQKRVWEELTGIAYGETASYAEIARRIGCATAVRAVANAVGANPISIFVPCHRVIGSNGRLTGYAGGLDAKRVLLGVECSAIFD